MEEFIKDTVAMAETFPNIATEAKVIFNNMTRVPVEHHDLAYAIVCFTLLAKADLPTQWD